MALEISINQKETGIYVVYPVGSIDSETHLNFKKALNPILELSPKIVIFDMEGVSFITSMGLSVLINTKKVLGKKGGKIMLVNLQPQIEKIFDMVKTIPPESIFKTMEDAENSIPRQETQ